MTTKEQTDALAWAKEVIEKARNRLRRIFGCKFFGHDFVVGYYWRIGDVHRKWIHWDHSTWRCQVCNVWRLVANPFDDPENGKRIEARNRDFGPSPEEVIQ